MTAHAVTDLDEPRSSGAARRGRVQAAVAFFRAD
jgi:hypothetical protein